MDAFMTNLGSTPWRPVKTRLLILLVGGVLWASLGCIVNDKALPCRRDCQCASGQFCSGGTCATGTPAPRTDGEEGGRCINNATCTGASLRCHPDGCGGNVCRLVCQRNATNSGCTGGTTCEDIRTGEADAGFLPSDQGVCVP